MAGHNAAAWLVDRHVDAGRGDRIAIECGGEETSYAELQREIWRAQRALTKLGVSTGDRVALVLNDDLAFPSWFLGALRSGIVPVPLSTMLTPAELSTIIADSESIAVVISEMYAGSIGEITTGAPTVGDVVVTGESPSIDGTVRTHSWSEFVDRDEVEVAPTVETSPAFWLYSSGTTGIPKGVMHVHGSMRATAETYARDVLQTSEADRFLSVAKLFFAYGLGNSLTFPLAVGGTAILCPDRPTPAGFIELVERAAPTLFFSSPGFLAALLDAAAPADAFRSVRATVTAGESLPANVHDRFTALAGHPVLDGIGSTELLHIFISNTLTDQSPGSSGRIVPGYDAELRDDDDQIVAASDVPGYLHVSGPSASVGYWQREEATAAAFRDGWVRTGDVYVRSAEDRWTFLGRNSDMIKAGGIWVSPAEVENVLIEHPGVLEAAVVGGRDADGLEMVVAFVVAASRAAPTPDELVQHCRDRMAGFKRPRRIVLVDDLPKTATGKIRRFALRDSLDPSPGPSADQAS